MSALECQTCGAALELADDQRTGRCLYCGSPAVVERPTDPTRPNPSFALGFVVTEARALEVARRWVKRPLFAPGAFRRARVDDIRGLYVPSYLYTAAAHSRFSARIAEHYTVVETYTTRDSKGRTVTRTRTRTKTEWRSLSGSHAEYVHDRVVTASKGLDNDALEAVEPFDLRALRRYTPKLISGWATEEPSLDVPDCLGMARTEALQRVRQRLNDFMPGDGHRELECSTELLDEDLELTLLPVWVLPVRYAQDRPPVRLLVNGQTGRIWGKAPVSAWKVGLSIALVVALALLAFYGGRL